MNIKDKSEKLIFCKPFNKQSFLDFVENKKINDYDGDDKIEQNIYYLIKTIFNPIGNSDILLDSSNEFSISQMMWSNVYNNSTIDLVWANTKDNLNNISFIKIFDKDLSTTDPREYDKEIYNFLIEVAQIYENTKNYLNEKLKNNDLYAQKLDLIRQILLKEYEQNDNLMREGSPEYIWNINQIEFNVYFYFPMSNDDEVANINDINMIFDKVEKINKAQKIYNTKKIIFKKENILTEDNLRIGYEENLNNTLLIAKDELTIDEPNNRLTFVSKDKRINKSYIVNLSALSLNKLWQKYQNKLLGMNLRLHITNKSVDNEIKNSIENEKEIFWFKNNGLVIICSNVKFSKDKIILENFSIINGGQTTFSIGKTKIEKDFFLVCKIIVLNNFSDGENIELDIHELSTEISLSTNNQKPIKKTDRISSISECRMLKQKLWKEKNIFLEIRRGDKPLRSKEIKNWQKTKAEVLQQIFYAFFKLKPGAARNKSASLFKTEILKESFAFMNTHETLPSIVELTKFWFIINEEAKPKNLKKLSKESFNNNETLLKKYSTSFVSYFKYYSFSLLFILILIKNNKKNKEYLFNKKHLIEEEMIKEKRKIDENFYKDLLNLWQESNIQNIFKYSDVDKISSTWKSFIYKNFDILFFKNIKDKNNEEIKDWTNFTKLDVNFYNVILNVISCFDDIEKDLEILLK